MRDHSGSVEDVGFSELGVLPGEVDARYHLSRMVRISAEYLPSETPMCSPSMALFATPEIAMCQNREYDSGGSSKPLGALAL